MLKKIFQSIVNKLGFSVVSIKRVTPIHIKNKLTSPLTIHYLLNPNDVLIYADVEKGRALPIHSYGRACIHPFSFAVKCAKNLCTGQQYSKILEILSIYYKEVSPSSIGELINAGNSSRFNSYPAWEIVMPWDKWSQPQWKEKVVKSVERENFNEGFKIGIDEGWAWFGPVSHNKLTIEARRLANILQSVQKNGYKRHDFNDGDIDATILLSGDDWVWQSNSAQHRACVLSALDWKEIPVRVSKIVRREDVKYWPNVLNNTYTPSEAIFIFDMIFNESYSHIENKWKDFMEKCSG